MPNVIPTTPPASDRAPALDAEVAALPKEPRMSDRCAPPAEHADERWHWLQIHDNAVVRFWWPGDGWHQPLRNIGSNDMARAGYRYLRPARPDDAEARERLEQENKRLREALEIAREGLLIVSGQRQCVDNLLSHEAIALEALRLIEEPGNAR